MNIEWWGVVGQGTMATRTWVRRCRVVRVVNDKALGTISKSTCHFGSRFKNRAVFLEMTAARFQKPAPVLEAASQNG